MKFEDFDKYKQTTLLNQFHKWWLKTHTQDALTLIKEVREKYTLGEYMNSKMNSFTKNGPSVLTSLTFNITSGNFNIKPNHLHYLDDIEYPYIDVIDNGSVGDIIVHLDLGTVHHDDLLDELYYEVMLEYNNYDYELNFKAFCENVDKDKTIIPDHLIEIFNTFKSYVFNEAKTAPIDHFIYQLSNNICSRNSIYKRMVNYAKSGRVNIVDNDLNKLDKPLYVKTDIDEPEKNLEELSYIERSNAFKFFYNWWIEERPSHVKKTVETAIERMLDYMDFHIPIIQENSIMNLRTEVLKDEITLTPYKEVFVYRDYLRNEHIPSDHGKIYIILNGEDTKLSDNLARMYDNLNEYSFEQDDLIMVDFNDIANENILPDILIERIKKTSYNKMINYIKDFMYDAINSYYAAYRLMVNYASMNDINEKKRLRKKYKIEKYEFGSLVNED